VRSCWKLLLCPKEPMPASSKTDLLLAKAKPISDSGSASRITFKKEKKPYATAIAAGERSENM